MKEKTAEKTRLDALVDPQCPPGHIALTDDERLEALDIAKKSIFLQNRFSYKYNTNIVSIFLIFLFCWWPEYQTLIDEINHMPITSRTLKVKNRQIEIEKELNELDDNLRVFSRQKVYVKIN